MYFCWYRSFYLPTMTQRKEAESQSSFTNVYFTLLLGKLSSASLNSVMLAQCARSWVRSMEIRDPITHSLYLQIASTMKQGGAKTFIFQGTSWPVIFRETSLMFIIVFLLGMGFRAVVTNALCLQLHSLSLATCHKKIGFEQRFMGCLHTPNYTLKDQEGLQQ